MEKDNQAKVGRTKCDLCDKLSAHVVGDRLLCEDHASMAKSAAAGSSLKDAGLAFRDHHR